MADFKALTEANAKRWAQAKITRGPELDAPARRLVAAKKRYQNIADRTGVPWGVIAVIHERESGQNFRRNLANGEYWDQVTKLVPKGRGPYRSFEASAYDALVHCPPKAAQWKDWSVGGALTLLERYNGLGYANGPRDIKGVLYPPQPSPYIWSGTDQYISGKYIRDGVYDPLAIDKQLGCAALLIAMKKLDASILDTPKPGLWKRLINSLKGD